VIQARLHKHLPAGRESESFALDIELSAGAGVTSLFGPSGAGKTLTLDAIAGFLQPDRGRVELDGRILYDGESGVFVPPRDRRCGYVFQNYALFPNMSVRDNMLFGASRFSRLEANRRVDAMMERFDLRAVAGRRPHQLSGGQRQRCSIARALVAEPRMLLLDEPARGLDAPLRSSLYEILREIQRGWELPVLLVTHNLDECFELASQLYIIQDGKVIQRGTPVEVTSQPANRSVAELLGLYNILAVEIEALDPSRNTACVRLGSFAVHCEYIPGHFKGDRVQMLVTPRQLRALPALEPPSQNQVPARLRRIVKTPSFDRLEFEGGIVVESPPASPHNSDWVIEFPTRGLRFL
jgi:molybdate transport system ATP-binding protein